MLNLIINLSSSSSSTGGLFVCVCVLTLLFPAKGALQLPENVTVPAVIVFGDSIVDTGNNNNLKTVVKCNFPPYGKDFPGGVPTGRFGNGRVPSDMIAEELGIKNLVPPYLDPTLSPQELLTGVCFASGGCGYDPLTPKLVSVLSFSDQIQYFKDYIQKLRLLVGQERTKFILENSLYIVVAGSDDIANTYYALQARKSYNIPAYTDLMANSAADFLEELYGLGARRIGIFSSPPIGCVPSQRTIAGGFTRNCAEKYNKAEQLFNQKLSAKVDSLVKTLPNSRIVYIDVYNPFLDLVQNPRKHGFEIVDKGCCGTGNLEVAILCNQLTSTTCSDESGYLFWDSYHPTEKAYKVLVSSVLQKYVNKFF